MEQQIYSNTTQELAQKRRELAPEIHSAFREFGKRVFADGALPEKTKQLIAVAVAHVTQCPYCIEGHTKAAIRAGATPEQLMEAIWVASEMRAGAAYAHATLALTALGIRVVYGLGLVGAGAAALLGLTVQALLGGLLLR